METFELQTDYIQLNHLLKAQGACPTGGMANLSIEQGLVKVDGKIEYRKRCKLRTGHIVEFADMLIGERSERSDGSGPILGLTVAEFRCCLVEAGQVRLLPIAMTTLTTIGGLLPLALAGGPLWEGMAWLMIFGLIVATLLTLVVVPCLYAVVVENLKVKPIPETGKDGSVHA